MARLRAKGRGRRWPSPASAAFPSSSAPSQSSHHWTERRGRTFCHTVSRKPKAHVEMRRQVELIGAGWGLGGPEPGCAEAPAVLTPLLITELERWDIPVRAGPILRPSTTERRRQLAVSRLCGLLAAAVDRESTRLNSSHLVIS